MLRDKRLGYRIGGKRIRIVRGREEAENRLLGYFIE